MTFARRLIAWYERGHRDPPWRRTNDPYRIWVSEIMLQQTRSATVVPFYERFLARFPTVEALAAASTDEALAAWSGLGYYSRVRNLQRSARAIIEAGRFPSDHAALLALPGIGEYTAAAIASIAFAQPYAAVDGNVLRVVARVSNDAADIGHPRTRRRFAEVAKAWLDRRRPGVFNQALMELGATVCLPREPLCLTCPVVRECAARAAGTQAQLPVKLRRTLPQQVACEALIVRRAGKLLLRLRPPGEGRLAGFWELPSPEQLANALPGRWLGIVRHTITHHHYQVTVRAAHFAGRRLPDGIQWFDPGDMQAIPVTTVTRKALRLEAGGNLVAKL